jgi:CBS domain containing-hemolysin-like protein
MTSWLVTSIGLLAAALGTTVAVSSASVSRLELARWISQRLRGAAIANALLSTPGRILGTATSIATGGFLLSAMGLSAVLATVPPLLRAIAVVLLAVPLLVIVAYAIPRAVGRRWPEPVIRRTGPLMERIASSLSPLVPESGSARGDLARVLRAGHQEGALGTDDLALFSGVVAFAERTVREIMTPRTDILAVPEGAPLPDVARLLAESGYSRLPVYRESLDNIVGMIYAFDLLKVPPGGILPVRPVDTVPAAKRCADLLYEMQRDGRQFAVVLDEFGGTAGLATFDDLLTELVSEVFDDSDTAQRAEQAPVFDLVELDGATPVAELAARFGLTMPMESGSVGGLLVRGAGRIPLVGERFVIGSLEFDVLAASPTRVERVAVRRGPVPAIPLPGGRRD